jgi:hypothetical protein
MTWNFKSKVTKKSQVLTAAADGGRELLEPLDLGAQGPVVPDSVAQSVLLEELKVHGGGTGDGHAGALLEVAAVRLGRRELRQAEVISCVLTGADVLSAC